MSAIGDMAVPMNGDMAMLTCKMQIQCGIACFNSVNPPPIVCGTNCLNMLSGVAKANFGALLQCIINYCNPDGGTTVNTTCGGAATQTTCAPLLAACNGS
jgi:hypothetical protein